MKIDFIMENWNNFIKEEDTDLSSRIAMRIKDIMPPEDVLSMSPENFRDLVVGVYDQSFDETGEGWDPYDEDLEAIRNHLTIDDDEQF